MIKNYLKVAWRNLRKNKIFSFINITGLAIGLSSFILITLYVMDELSYDQFNKNADRIFRVNSDIVFGGAKLHFAVSSDPMGATLKKDYPDIEEFTRLYVQGDRLIKKGREYITETRTANADSTFFNVFTFPAIAGDTRTALNEPNTVVITESAAKKYFGEENPIGRTIETNENNSTLYKVMAVIKDMPSNSHFHFDFLFSMKNADYRWGNYLSQNFHTYLLLRKGVNYKTIESKFPEYIDRYVGPQAEQMMHIKSMAEFEKAGNKMAYSLIPLTSIHLYSDWALELSAGGDIQYVYIFSGVALFILLIACINFMNLTTARSGSRAREVGIRKVLGTERKNLIWQFLSESTLMAILSMLLAIGLTYFALPLFNDLSAKSMQLESLTSSRFLPLLIALPLIVGLIAGSYPAFYLSAFKPIQVLKGKLNFGSRKSAFRSGLVVFQFASSIILVIATIVIFRQLNYIRTKDIGFNKDQVLIIDNAYALDKNIDAFKNELLQSPNVKSATVSAYLPVSSSRTDDVFSKEAVLDTKNGLSMQVWPVDYDYLKTLGIELAKGRNFSPDFGSDSSAIIVNETAAKLLGYDDPLNKKIFHSSAINPEGQASFNIIGVIKDFHFESMRQPIGALSLVLGRSTGILSLKVLAGHANDVKNLAESKWKAMAPGMPYSYRFLDESFDRIYRNEQRVGKISMLFSLLAIFIACLGLFGLATFIAEQRTKEIGIRKVLGASTEGIVELLSRDFLKLVLIAFAIAAPLAGWFMHKWLQDFAYRVNIGWWVFVIAGLAALAIALITVSIQAIRAALANPVKSLRTE